MVLRLPILDEGKIKISFADSLNFVKLHFLIFTIEVAYSLRGRNANTVYSEQTNKYVSLEYCKAGF